MGAIKIARQAKDISRNIYTWMGNDVITAPGM